jgi:hypothetical protein
MEEFVLSVNNVPFQNKPSKFGFVRWIRNMNPNFLYFKPVNAVAVLEVTLWGLGGTR